MTEVRDRRAFNTFSFFSTETAMMKQSIHLVKDRRCSASA